MKKWYYVLLLLLLCATFTACGTKSTSFPSDKLKSEIEEAYELELLTENNIKSISEYHEQFRAEHRRKVLNTG